MSNVAHAGSRRDGEHDHLHRELHVGRIKDISVLLMMATIAAQNQHNRLWRRTGVKSNVWSQTQGTTATFQSGTNGTDNQEDKLRSYPVRRTDT